MTNKECQKIFEQEVMTEDVFDTKIVSVTR